MQIRPNSTNQCTNSSSDSPGPRKADLKELTHQHPKMIGGNPYSPVTMTIHNTRKWRIFRHHIRHVVTALQIMSFAILNLHDANNKVTIHPSQPYATSSSKQTKRFQKTPRANKYNACRLPLLCSLLRILLVPPPQKINLPGGLSAYTCDP